MAPGPAANHPQSHPVVQIRRNLPVTTHAILRSGDGPDNKPRATHKVFPRAPPTTTNIPRAMAHSPTRTLLRLCLTSSFDSAMVIQMASHTARPTHMGRPMVLPPCIPISRSKHMQDILNSRPKPASTLTPINHYPLTWAPMVYHRPLLRLHSITRSCPTPIMAFITTSGTPMLCFKE